jgi:two-component system, LytTR family, sensor kinase
MRWPRLTQTRVILGIATLLSLYSAFQAFQYVAFFAQQPTSIWILLTLNAGYWYSWALLAPVVIWLSQRFPIDRDTWRRSLPLHLVAIFGVTIAHILLSESVRAGLVASGWMGAEWGQKYSYWNGVKSYYFRNFDWEMMTYWAIVGGYYAFSYSREAQDRTLRTSQLEARLAEAQLQALQRQLHPHFLFNTLNAISALMHRDVEAADQMLAKLSDLLRMALDQRGGQEVSLKDELEFLQKYLEIEEARFGDRLSVTFDIAPETLDAQVPNLLLQPLVENSIRHAVAVRIEPGCIEIRARQAGESLELVVRDNGPGMPPSRVAAPGKGVGLANTRSRLERLYGANHQLLFSEPPGGGLMVTVTIPFKADDLTETDDFAEDFKGVA